MSAGTLSAAGEALHRLPAMVARLRTCTEPMRLAASTTPGHAAASALFASSAVQAVAAPMAKPPSASERTPLRAPIRFTSIIAAGATLPARICTSRSVPPESTRAAGLPESRLTACAIESGA